MTLPPPNPLPDRQIIIHKDFDTVGLTQRYTVDEPVPIIDGRVVFRIPHMNIVMDIAVKQIKGDGSRLADSMTEPTPEHIEILQAIIDRLTTNTEPVEYFDKYTFTAENVRYWVNARRKNLKLEKEMQPGSVLPRLSELKRKQIVYSVGKGKFKLNFKKGQWTIDRKSFLGLENA